MCDWDFGHETPSFANLTSNPAVKMWVKYATFPPGQSTNKIYGESILKSIQLSTSNSYLITFRIKKYNSFPLPDLFKVKLLHSSDVSSPSGTSTRNPLLYELNSNQSQDIVEIYESAMDPSGNWQTFTFCFTPNSNYDRILFYPYEVFSSTAQDWILLDDVSLKVFDFSINNPTTQSATSCAVTSTLNPDISCLPSNATFSYSWTPTDGLSNPNVLNPIATTNPFQTSNYSLELTYTNPFSGTTCSASSQVSINKASNVLSSGSDLNDLWQLLGLAPSTNPITNQDIFLSGTFFIESDITFDNCRFSMDENAKIVVKNGAKLTLINGTEFNSCSDGIYWNAIVVKGNTGASIYVDGCKFYNGTSTININGTPGEFEIKSSLFDKNKTAITINSTTPFTSDSTVILNNTFQCSSPLIDNNYQSYYPTYSIKLIRFRFSSTDPSKRVKIQSNTFYGSGGTLYLFDSRVDASLNTFNGFNNQFTFPGSPLIQEKAVHIQGFQGNLSNDSTRIINNWFNYNKTSIFGRVDLHMIIRGNNIDNSNSPHYISNLPIPLSNAISVGLNDLKTTIEENAITVSSNGIVVTNCKNALLSKNHLVSPAYAPYNAAIDYNYTTGIQISNPNIVSSYTNPPALDVKVTSNQMVGLKIGIHTNFAHALINKNQVIESNTDLTPASPCGGLGSPCPAPNSIAIQAINDVVYILENKVLSLTGSNVDDKNIGISIENSYHVSNSPSKVNCNLIENSGIGIQFLSYCGDFTEVIDNELKSNFRGITLDEQARLGNIGGLTYNGAGIPISKDLEAGNLYIGNFQKHTFNYEHYIDPNNPLVDYSPKHLILAGSQVPGPTIGVLDADPGFNIQGNISANGPNGASCSVPLPAPLISKGQTISNNLKSNGRNWLNRSNYKDSTFRLLSQLMYHQLSQDSVLFKNRNWKHFTDSMDLTTFGRLKGRNQRFNFNTSSNFDQNISSLTPLVIKIENDIPLSKMELQSAKNIALMCPYDDGIAVYLARSILAYYGSPIFNSACKGIQIMKGRKQKRAKDEGTQNERAYFELFPNPNNGIFSIDIKIEESQNAFIKVFSLNGKLLNEQKFNVGDSHKFNFSGLQPGVYILRCIDSNAILMQRKLVISHE